MGDEWEKIGGSGVWLPSKEDETMEGEVVSIIADGSYGLRVEVRPGDSDDTILTPSHKVLQSRLLKARLQAGDQIRITYKGETPPAVEGQNPMKLYELEKKKK